MVNKQLIIKFKLLIVNTKKPVRFKNLTGVISRQAFATAFYCYYYCCY